MVTKQKAKMDGFCGYTIILYTIFPEYTTINDDSSRPAPGHRDFIGARLFKQRRGGENIYFDADILPNTVN